MEIIAGCAETVNNHPVYENYLIDPYVHTGENITGVMFSRYCKDGYRHTLFMNYGDAEETIRVRVTAGGEPPTIWDTYTGQIRKATVVRQDGDLCILALKLPNTHGIVLVTKLQS